MSHTGRIIKKNYQDQFFFIKNVYNINVPIYEMYRFVIQRLWIKSVIQCNQPNTNVMI